ncbi:hypothetical protein FB480_1095 [Agrobacterium vitis]|nr:hypothetical protein FB480_1095 [Agrobacterium vitis]
MIGIAQHIPLKKVHDSFFLSFAVRAVCVYCLSHDREQHRPDIGRHIGVGHQRWRAYASDCLARRSGWNTAGGFAD